MVKNKKRTLFLTFIFSVLIILISFMIFTFKHYKPTTNKSTAALTIADFMFKEIEKGNISTDVSIDAERLLQLAGEYSDVYKAFINADFIDVFMLDNHTVMFISDVIFQSVRGYLVTDGLEITSYRIDVPHDFGFDGDNISVHKSEKYDNLYSWDAGL